METEWVQICPRCNSPDIETDFSNAAGVVRGYFNVKRCNHCGHHGTFFPMITLKSLKKVRKVSEIKDIELMDKNFATGAFNLYTVLLGLFFLLIGTVSLFYRIGTFSVILFSIGVLILAVYLLIRRKSKKQNV